LGRSQNALLANVTANTGVITASAPIVARPSTQTHELDKLAGGAALRHSNSSLRKLVFEDLVKEADEAEAVTRAQAARQSLTKKTRHYWAANQ
jgi:hypothetical protein